MIGVALFNCMTHKLFGSTSDDYRKKQLLEMIGDRHNTRPIVCTCSTMAAGIDQYF